MTTKPQVWVVSRERWCSTFTHAAYTACGVVCKYGAGATGVRECRNVHICEGGIGGLEGGGGGGGGLRRAGEVVEFKKAEVAQSALRV